MKAKCINNRPVSFSDPEKISVGDIIEENNPPRGVNFWEVVGINKTEERVEYTVKMLKGSAFVGSVYVRSYVFKYPEKKLPTHWFFDGMVSAKSIK